MIEVGIIRTGVANMASVRAALLRAGAQPHIIETARDAARFDRLVLPGVGAFGAAMSALRENGLDETVQQHIARERPLFAVCLGLQLLADESEESPGCRGLGVFRAKVTRFPDGLRVPQFGWNAIRVFDAPHLEDGWAYFANTYRLEKVPDGFNGATSIHGDSFVAAVSSGVLLACQFHPELSGAYGAKLIQSWLRG